MSLNYNLIIKQFCDPYKESKIKFKKYEAKIKIICDSTFPVKENWWARVTWHVCPVPCWHRVLVKVGQCHSGWQSPGFGEPPTVCGGWADRHWSGRFRWSAQAGPSSALHYVWRRNFVSPQGWSLCHCHFHHQTVLQRATKSQGASRRGDCWSYSLMILSSGFILQWSFLLTSFHDF